MKNKLNVIIASMSLAIVGGICLSAPEITNAKTKTTSETTLLAQNRCQVNQFENRVFQLTNSIRQRNGLRSLTWNCQLITAAKSHSQTMARSRRMFHSNFNLAENVARGQQSPEQVVNDWMNSPGHRRNILNRNVTQIGVGFDNGAWTQVFR
ncbi:SCP-like extracellular (fragment) [Hyella patelloides LEGE 07179]|uniref:SCP-like extracellular n=1 Tax=Hyella patelloides LEGE 07179 TaxID=945734 RepID=A0A563W3M4_9CYAN